ncbi:Fe2+-enterobactin ABC transporter substrate-binding protein [Corynebacterium falsenii]|uniref:Fe2+-enterobactin ABC transporter substrate-binding protein n=1 Tax=Corynebacterium falsenii TaxID=108486 RepID=UPI001D8AB430|nr:Fe2+-enterobactin ABC transporter substrate-binding protein [Corynebacterium falsenii]HJF12583.1 Fe2+-enterobactin ABC transporter substrate-binding protein [Corynebacterium falsenii]
MDLFTKRSHIGRYTAASIASLLALSLASCSERSSEPMDTATQSTASQSATSSEKQGQWPRTIESLDGDGKKTEVTIEHQPERIVSTSVTLTGSLLAIDAPVKATGTVNNRPPLANSQGFFTQWADVADQRGVEPIYQGQPSVEAILAQKPDLVVMSSSGQDSAIDLYNQLAGTVPTLVVDYSRQGWEDTARALGKATGHESGAEDAIHRYDERVKEVKESITKPEQPVNIVSLAKNNGGLNFWTKNSAQGRVLTDLGFDVAQPPENLVDTTSQYAKRKDARPVSAENSALALTGRSIFALNADGKTKPSAAMAQNPQLATVPAVKDGHVYDLAPEDFRIDYYSAMNMLDEIKNFFAK